MSDETLYSAVDAAKAISRSLRAVQRAAKDKSIGSRISNRLVFREADLDKLRVACQDGPGQPKKVTPAEKSPARKPTKKRGQ